MMFGDYLEYFFPLLLPNGSKTRQTRHQLMQLTRNLCTYIFFFPICIIFTVQYMNKSFIWILPHIDHDLQQSSCFQPCLRIIPQRVKLCSKERWMSSNLSACLLLRASLYTYKQGRRLDSSKSRPQMVANLLWAPEYIHMLWNMKLKNIEKSWGHSLHTKELMKIDDICLSFLYIFTL